MTLQEERVPFSSERTPSWRVGLAAAMQTPEPDRARGV